MGWKSRKGTHRGKWHWTWQIEPTTHPACFNSLGHGMALWGRSRTCPRQYQRPESRHEQGKTRQDKATLASGRANEPVGPWCVLMRPGTHAEGKWTPAAWKEVLQDPTDAKEARAYQVRSAAVFISAALGIPKTDVIAAHPIVGGEVAQASVGLIWGGGPRSRYARASVEHRSGSRLGSARSRWRRCVDGRCVGSHAPRARRRAGRRCWVGHARG